MSYKLMKIKDVIDIQIDNRGKNPENYYELSNFPVIDNYLIKNQIYPNLEEVKRYIDKNTKDNFLRNQLKKDDVLITLVGNGIGNVTMVPTEECVIIQNTLGLRCNDLMLNKYLFYYLIYLNKTIRNLDRGSSQPSIKKTDLFEIKIKVPEIQYQNKIVNLLYNLDRKILINRNIILNLEFQAQAIFKSWFVDFDPFEDGEFIESELGMIPKGFEVIDVKNIFDFETGSEPGSKNYMNKNNSLVPFYRVGEMLNETDIYVDIDLLKGKIAKTDDVLVSFDGTVGRVTTGISGGFSSGIKKVLSKVDYISNSFIYVLFKSDLLQNIIKAHATGTTILHASKSIVHMKLPFNKEVYNRFSKIIDPLIKYIRELKIQNKVLNETRDTLLPKLMSGEIRLEED